MNNIKKIYYDWIDVSEELILIKQVTCVIFNTIDVF